MIKIVGYKKNEYGELESVNVLHDALNIECKPVVHAHWIPEKINKREHINSFQCSNCGHDVLNHLYYLSNDCDFIYCPYCGSKMEEAKDE